MDIFNLIKTQDFDKLKNILLENKNIDIEIKDENNNYLLHYIVNFNKIDILKILLDKDIRIDILDFDGRTILYIPIKYNYIDMLKLLLLYNSKLIGISIIDIKDKFGLTPLHYATIFNNLDMVKILYKNDADPLLKDNNGNNILHTALKYKCTDILLYFLNENINIDFLNNTNETFLQLAITYENYKVIHDILLKKNNINHQENEYGLSALHYSIIFNDLSIIKKIISSGADINLQDYYGSTALMYSINDKLIEITEELIKYPDINYNLTNIDGNTALHILLINNINNINILTKLIIETDLSIQNNNGDTCLHYLINNKIIIKDILIKKELNIFISNNDNINCYQLIQKNNEMIELIINSYYYYLKNNNNKLLLEWENKCKNGKITLEKCKKKIKDIIINENRSIPKIKEYNLILDNGILINNCFYTGFPIDILFGLLFLSKYISIIIDYPLTEYEEFEKHNRLLGINKNYDFYNFEIIWSYQKLFFPTYFDLSFEKKIKTDNYITIPIGIETSSGSHANILFYDVKNKILERFEPNGANPPVELNSNFNLLDQLLLNKFKTYDNEIKLLTPKDYLPIIGFQMLENIGNTKCKKIGDPTGFCGVWCTWWIYQKIKNIDIPSKLLAEKLIKQIKLNNITFKVIIRNFSSNIVVLRDKFLNKYKIDINDFINNENETLINNLEKDILNYKI